jgi:hypothetical protein
MLLHLGRQGGKRLRVADSGQMRALRLSRTPCQRSTWARACASSAASSGDGSASIAVWSRWMAAWV